MSIRHRDFFEIEKVIGDEEHSFPTQELREFYNGLDLAVSISHKGRLVFENIACLKLFGYDSNDELSGTSITEQIAESDRAMVIDRSTRRSRGETVEDYKWVMGLRKDGTVFPMNIRVSSSTFHNEIYAIAFFIDLSEVFDAQTKAFEFQNLLSAIVEGKHHMIWVVDASNFGLLFFNNIVKEYFRQSRDLTIENGMKPEDLFQDEAIVQLWYQTFQTALREKYHTIEWKIPFRETCALLHLSALEREGHPYGIAVFGEDITQRKETENQLKYSEERFRVLSENALTGIFILHNNALSYVNPAMERIFGYSSEEVIGASAVSFLHPDDQKAGRELFYKAQQESSTMQYEARAICKDKTVKYVEILTVQVQMNDVPTTIGNLIDITERKTALNRLRESEEFFRTAFENAYIGAALTSIDGKFLQVNNYLCDILSYNKEELIGRSFNDITYEADRQIGIDIIAKLLSGESDRASFEKRYITKQGDIVWFLGSIGIVRDIAGKPLYFVTYLQNITDRITAEKNLSQSYEKLSIALHEIVTCLSSAIEQKDPYTNGHQQRVSDLAVAIATEMGISADTIEGIRIAGMIHDIGKISIPSDILSKPTKLNELEMSFIRLHVINGFTILNNIHFTWPIAEIVYQHHERMDGSGYPRGLMGDQMMIEARILAVADVVEAMSSHRPYRPMLGLDAALDEISRNRGTLYDPQVVEHCVRLFREKGFTLSV